MDTKNNWKWAKTILPLIKNYGDVTFAFLKRSLSHEQIDLYLSFIEDLTAPTLRVSKDKIMQEYNQPPEIFAALKGLSRIRTLCEAFENQSDETTTLELAATTAFMCIHDGLELGLALDGPNKEQMKKAADKAAAFTGKGRSLDKFSRLLMDMLSEDYGENNKFPDWNTVKNRLKKLEGGGVITIVDESKELISLSYSEPVSFSSLRERLTRIKKSIRKEK